MHITTLQWVKSALYSSPDMKTRTAYRILMYANARYLRDSYGESFYRRFRNKADTKLNDLLPRIPDLDSSVAALSYGFITAYVPFFYSFGQFDETREKAGELIWVMNENLVQRFPSVMRNLMGRVARSEMFVRSLRAAQAKGDAGLLHPMDWRVVVEELSAGSYCYTWTQCGALQALRAIGEDGVFPYACRIDYLMANQMGLEFTRTKTLADGDDCCNNCITGRGFTEWAPEKGFEFRK